MNINPNTQADLIALNAKLVRMEWNRADENDRLVLTAVDEDGDEFDFDSITITATDDIDPYTTAEGEMIDRHGLPFGFPLRTAF